MRGEAVRRLALHLLVAVVAAACVALGFWQLRRHAGLQERNALLEARLAGSPAPYDERVMGLDPDAPLGSEADATHRPVHAEGRFDAEHEVLLRSRSLEGRPGHHVITPLVLDRPDGTDEPTARAVLVDRGWIPYTTDEAERVEHEPPAGRVRVTGRLMPEEDPPEGPLASLAPRDPASGPLATVARVDVERLEGQIPFALEPFLIQAERITPVEAEEGDGGGAGAAAPGDAAASFPIVPPPPAPEGGPHLGYALQWFSFAAIAAVGYVLLLRSRGRDEGREGDPRPG